MKRVFLIKGFSNLEAVIMAMVLAFVSFSVVNFLLQQKKLSYNNNLKQVLVDTVSQNVVDMNSQPLSSLPLPNRCLVREYTADGRFAVQTPPAGSPPTDYPLLTAADCTDTAPSGAGIKVIVRVKDSSAISVSFDPSTHLKLPSTVNSILQVQLVGRMRQKATDAAGKEYALTLFRRAS